jgi:hypothetical protein
MLFCLLAVCCSHGSLSTRVCFWPRTLLQRLRAWPNRRSYGCSRCDHRPAACCRHRNCGGMACTFRCGRTGLVLSSDRDFVSHKFRQSKRAAAFREGPRHRRRNVCIDVAGRWGIFHSSMRTKSGPRESMAMALSGFLNLRQHRRKEQAR